MAVPFDCGPIRLWVSLSGMWVSFSTMGVRCPKGGCPFGDGPFGDALGTGWLSFSTMGVPKVAGTRMAMFAAGWRSREGSFDTGSAYYRYVQRLTRLWRENLVLRKGES